MDTSDTGPQSPPQAQLTQPRGHPALAEKLRAKAAAGELLDCGAGPFDLAAMQQWGEERAVSAAVLRDLLVGGRWPVHAKGVRLRGVKISGLLDLEGATLRCPLSLDGCYFDAGDPVSLDHATASRVALTGCHLAGLTANMLTARQIDLSRSTLRGGPLCLMSANITDGLICSGARLGGDQDGNALVAGGMKVGGAVYLDRYLDEPFTAAGAVWLARADIGGDLACDGAQLGSNHDGVGLLAEGIRVGGEVHLYRGFTADGAVVLNGADITGDISFSGAQLTGTDRDGNALAADGMKVGAAVLLDEGFTSAGTVSLNFARADQLALSPAKAAGADEITFNFTATEAQIACELRWAPDGPFSGRVNLEDAQVGELEDTWTPAGEQARGYWPPGGRLRLSGFTYGGLGEASVKQRLQWIRSQYEGPKPAAFAAQPYEQLADIYRQAGQDSEAREVAIARRRDLRRYGNLNWYRWFGNWFLDKTIRYGYQTWRAALGLAAVFVLFLVLSIAGQHRHVIVPLGDVKGLDPVPTATRCTSDYPCFYPFGYTVDTVIPIINVHQADHWGPDAHAPAGWLWVFGAWGATAAGWALATLLVAGYTGLVRQN